MTRRWVGTLAALAVPLAVAACDLDLACHVEDVYGIQVIIEDSLSTDPIADSALATATDQLDGFVDTLEVTAIDIAGRPWYRGGVVDRTGTYTVYVQRPGYQDWAATGITVSQGECGIIPATLRARMFPVTPTPP